ncbi:T9SS type A sorting domain-containing protein [Robiginitalea sp. M366]|uniref:T9SS type A sorting domain-containing protein n=1 Tax=Robiginitalea aestuariiviva TaxID=3036903 RepID=UPI00240DDF82|nr:T9SS type A sorting domain-containing protein [Robiginitalea aestuariiviva]MDG1570805.1 T9SS type A sorting domain-containing protein [Robiginitalea aestuariiviva]
MRTFPKVPLATAFLFWMPLLFLQPLAAQDLPLDPNDCGYSCSASDVILTNPFLSADISGTPIGTCDGETGETFVAYIAFTMTNTTGNLRYTPMIHARLNIDGATTVLSGCYPDLAANSGALYVSPLAYTFNCGSEVFLEDVWVGWNVSPTDCGDIATAKGCNQLVPAGKCGDYNFFPVYLSMPADGPVELGPENTAKRCSDGVDNDANGLIDCDDFECTPFENCDYTETTSGEEGGLESNPRLLEKIARRQYQRSREAGTREPVVRPGNTLEAVRGKVRTRRSEKADWTLRNMLPDGTALGAEAYVSSPEDLGSLTNALETFAADYLQEGTLKGAILATRTASGVYEHTKVICDRVDGTRLSGIWKVDLYHGQPLLMSKLERPGGVVEYSCSFSARVDAGGSLHVENFWNVAEYTPGSGFMNFQVWAADPMSMRTLTRGVLDRLLAQTSGQASFAVGETPELYILQSTYRNRVLELEIANPAGLKTVQLHGMRRRTETDTDQAFTQTQTLSGAARETLQFDTEGIYSLGLTFSPQAGTPDTVFFADGSWGLDADPASEQVTLSVFRDVQSENDQDWYVERGIRIQGVLHQQMAWYRALKNTFAPVDLSPYTGLAFRTQSESPLELQLVLTSPGVAWEDLPKKTLQVGAGMQEHRISLDDWAPEARSQVSMMTFVVRNRKETPQTVRLEMNQLRFTVESPEQASAPVARLSEAQVRLYPNPVSDRAKLVFRAAAPGEARWQVFSSGGQQLRAGTATVRTGENQVQLPVNGLASGVYLAEIGLPEGRRLQVRMVVR